MPNGKKYTPGFRGNQRSSRGYNRNYRADDRYNYKRNHEIRSQEVRLIDSDGTNHGVVDIKQAMGLATEQGFDLVEISPQADPPVCKIISWSKFVYEQKRKEKQARKNKQKEMKEVRFGTHIADGDKERQLARTKEFLNKGHNVKITVTRKGRTPVQQSKELLNDLLTLLSGYSTIDPNPSVEGRRVSIIFKGSVGGEPKKTVESEEKLTNKDKEDAKNKDKQNSSKTVQKDKTQGREGIEDSVQQK